MELRYILTILTFFLKLQDINLQLWVIKSELHDTKSQMHHVIKSEYRDKVDFLAVVSLHLAINFFPQNCEINSQLRVMKSNSEEQKILFSHNSDYMTHNCKFISYNSEKKFRIKSELCDKMSRLPLFIFISGANKFSIIYTLH